MIKKTLSKLELEEIFVNEAVYIAGIDCITREKAVNMLGLSAVEYAEKQDKPGSRYYGIFCGGDGFGEIHYLTLTGFLEAVSYHNMKTLLRAKMINTDRKKVIPFTPKPGMNTARTAGRVGDHRRADRRTRTAPGME